MTGRANNGRRNEQADATSGDQVRDATARFEAAVNELVAVAGARAVRQVERAVARLRVRTADADAIERESAPPPPPPPPLRQPLWLWSNKPRSRKLYRSPRRVGDGKLLGVCSGIANLYGLEPFVVRLAVIAIFFFTQGAAFLAYLAAAMIMDIEPAAEAEARRNGQTPPLSRTARRAATKRAAHAKTPAAAPAADPTYSTKATLAAVRDSYAMLEKRMRRLEHFVTSDHFDLHREFAKIDDGRAQQPTRAAGSGSP